MRTIHQTLNKILNLHQFLTLALQQELPNRKPLRHSETDPHTKLHHQTPSLLHQAPLAKNPTTALDLNLIPTSNCRNQNRATHQLHNRLPTPLSSKIRHRF
ncbi:hypothetical protein KC19_3G250400 [Ceratodon purpureus]|uniref:Uncharacterized protein n=1 Tax=Ceratodon purpureus TaxID=3225 RepID=A0A8T0IPP2_CERPU|nr:hypothetical protein KC19_3G250400 [Ceratodon purpureus]